MIDAHVHLWRIGRNGCTWPPPEMPALHRDFTLADWRMLDGTDGVHGIILVQSQEHPADTQWLLELARDEPTVLGVVGWTDLSRDDADQRVASLAREVKLCGLRPMMQDRAVDCYDDPTLERGWTAMEGAGLVLDALIRPAQLSSVSRLAARYPELRIVIDHAAKPCSADFDGWRVDIEATAAYPNVYCKLSGLRTEARPDDPPNTIEVIVATLINLFGPDRLLWGSDWPVLSAVSRFREWLDEARRLVPAAMHGAVFGGTAASVYRLQT